MTVSPGGDRQLSENPGIFGDVTKAGSGLLMTGLVGGGLHRRWPGHIRPVTPTGKELFGAKRVPLVYVRGAPTEARR
jgi:hypothetical protein